MTEFNNLDNLTAWLDANLKCPHGVYDLDAVRDDVVKQYRETGSTEYELSSWESKSGRPEIYRYDYVCEIDEDGDIVREVFTF